MKKTKLIPFRALPGSWGLSGQIYKEAEASYYLKPGEDLDRELARIRYYDDNREEYNRKIIEIEFKYRHIDEFERDKKIAKLETVDKKDFERRLLEIKFKHEKITAFERDEEILKLDGVLTKEQEIELSFKHGRIDEYTKDLKLAKLINDEEEKSLAMLDVEYNHGKIKKNTYEKRRATLLKEPWIGIIDHGFDAKKGVNGVFFEFDWNHYWIEYLELNGYSGPTEDDIVESWFSDVCNSTNVVEDEKFQNAEDF